MRLPVPSRLFRRRAIAAGLPLMVVMSALLVAVAATPALAADAPCASFAITKAVKGGIGRTYTWDISVEAPGAGQLDLTATTTPAVTSFGGGAPLRTIKPVAVAAAGPVSFEASMDPGVEGARDSSAVTFAITVTWTATGAGCSNADGTLSSSAVATTTVVLAQNAGIQTGTSGADHFIGTAGDDVLLGKGGNDVIKGGKGDDRVDGGPGNDKLDGGAGKDKILGGSGNDSLTARDKTRDIISCGSGIDSVTADKMDVVSKDCEHVSKR